MFCICCQCFFCVYRIGNLFSQIGQTSKNITLIQFLQKYLIYLISYILHISIVIMLVITTSTHVRIIIRNIFLNFLNAPGPFQEDKLGKSRWHSQIQSLLPVHSRPGFVQKLNNQAEIEVCIYDAIPMIMLLSNIPNIELCSPTYLLTCQKWLQCPGLSEGISSGRSIQQHPCGSKQFIRLTRFVC